MPKNDIHIGKIIKDVFETRNINISEFAELLNCERTNIHKIFKRKSIDTDMLVKISQILNYDFLREVYGKSTACKIEPPNSINIVIEMKSILCKIGN
jgi:transcriptional regulator with XRE-family HTH domain